MDAFAAAVLDRDLDAMAGLLADDVVFRSPVVFRPYRGKDAVLTILGAVMQVFGEFRYTARLRDDEGRHALVFETWVGEKSVHGCDFLTVDADGRIVEFDVMVRPLSGAHALAEAMAQRLG